MSIPIWNFRISHRVRGINDFVQSPTSETQSLHTNTKYKHISNKHTHFWLQTNHTYKYSCLEWDVVFSKRIFNVSINGLFVVCGIRKKKTSNRAYLLVACLENSNFSSFEWMKSENDKLLVSLKSIIGLPAESMNGFRHPFRLTKSSDENHCSGKA